LGYEGQIDWGCINAYVKAPEAYVADYRRLIDWASRNRFNGVIVWGFLRDSHGGIAAAQTICKYANEVCVFCPVWALVSMAVSTTKATTPSALITG
jgi:hypothetical protein